jgi:hypothetical protein
VSLISLSGNYDSVYRKLTPSGLVTVKLTYADLMNGHIRFHRRYLWKLKMSLKIKVFIWFLNKKVLLTQDNLSKRNSNESTKCCFCDSEETVNHHFISCPFAMLVWHVVDDTFDIHHRLILQLYGNWVNGIDRKTKAKIHIGVSTLCCFI